MAQWKTKIVGILAAVACVVNASSETRTGDARLLEAAAEDDPVIDIATSMVEWMKKGGGYMNQKLEIRRRIPGDRKSPTGIFATQNIDEDEVLFHIPFNLYLRVEDDEIVKTTSQDDDGTDSYSIFSWNDYYSNTCILSQHLLNETKKYRESPANTRFAPYIRYLEETQPRGQVPATYSHRGKQILRDIQGDDSSLGSLLPQLDLVDWIDNELLGKGCFHADDEDAYHAAAVVVQRGFDLDLVPVWDFVNHDVLERINVMTTPIREEGGLRVWASKAIRPGDEILYSYNYCVDCHDVGEEKGTPGMYQDFGFVEGYPQEWNFVKRNLYVLVEGYEDGGVHVDELILEGVDGTVSHIPDQEDVDFFLAHLSRLGSLDIHSRIEQLDSPYERAMIQAYYESAMLAVSSIVNRGFELLYRSESTI